MCIHCQRTKKTTITATSPIGTVFIFCEPCVSFRKARVLLDMGWHLTRTSYTCR